jgi:hypothetical protein
MPASAFNKFNVFTFDLVSGAHDFDAHVFKAMLTNTAPVATNAVKADITEITATGGYPAGGTAGSISVSTATGTAKVVSADVTFTGSGGGFGPFRYVVWYNDTQSTPAKPLVAWFDYGSSISVGAAETFTVDFDGSLGAFTVT